MTAPRDSIYNVSSNIHLEDYNEKSSGGQTRGSSRVKFWGFVALFVVLSYSIYRFFAYINAPEYKLAIANLYINDSNVTNLAKIEKVSVSADKPVYIRFDWGSTGELQTDYVRIGIYKLNSDGKQEEAVLGRRKPVSADYIYFMGPLEAGQYILEVSDRKGNILKTKNFKVR